MTFVQIGEFDLLSGRQKGSIFVKIFKILPLRYRKENEAEAWHTCKGHRPLQNLFFHSSRIRTLVAMVTYSFHRFIMGKVELGNFYCLIGDDRILFLQKCF